MEPIRNIIRKTREEEVKSKIEDLERNLSVEGYLVEFGKIGKKTTYALIYNEDHSIEYVGYTFIKNLGYYNENTGKLKALQQAIARMENLSE